MGLCLAVLVTGAAVLPAGGAGAQQEPPSATAPTTVPTTSPPASTPGSTIPSPTSTTVPAVPVIPDHEHGEMSALTPAQTLAAEAEYATLTDSQRALLRQLQSAKEALAFRRFALVALARDVAAAQVQLEAARAVERQARARVEETAARLQLLEDEVVALAAAAYRNHTDTWVLGSLQSVDSGNASTIARAKMYARADASFLGDRIDVLAALQRRLEAERRTAETARAAAEATAGDLDARLAAQRQAYDETAAAATKTQAAVARSLGADVSLVAQMLDPQFGGDNATSVLSFVQAEQAEPTTLDGIFSLPIPGASLSSLYGLRIDPISGTIAFHAGLDFGVPMKTPIRPAAPGMVVIAGDCGGYGNCIVVDHGTKLGTLYGHLSQIDVRPGDTVTVDQVIGLVGSTGKSTGPHLHFEVRLRGAPIDPVPTLAG